MLLPFLMVRDPELINNILITDFSHFVDRSVPIAHEKDLLSLGVGSLTGNKWRIARQIVAPTFTSVKLKLMFDQIKECSDEVIKYLKGKKGQNLQVNEVMQKYIIKVTGSVTFGLTVDPFNDEIKNNDYIKYTSKFINPSVVTLMKMCINMVIPKEFTFKITDSQVNTFFRNLAKNIITHRNTTKQRRNDFLQLLLDEKKKEEKIKLQYFDTILPDCIEDKEAQHNELIDELKNTQIAKKMSLKTSEIITEDFIAAQAFGFISSGSEITSTTLTLLLFELATNQDVQEKLKEEILDVLSKHGLNYEATLKMTYLDQCIYETLRIHPILPEISRLCTSDYKLPGEDYTIKKGTFIQIPVLGLHMDPQYFPEPEKFDPNRFEDMQAIPKNVFFPFGGGPRYCIAMRFAMLEVKVLTSAILTNFTVNLSHNQKLPLKLKKYSIVGNIEGGLWAKFNDKEK